MPKRNEEPPPIVQRERKRGTLLTFLALGLLILLALFLLLGDDLFTAAEPMVETNEVVRVEPGGE
jgi:hypothetical protein